MMLITMSWLFNAMLIFVFLGAQSVYAQDRIVELSPAGVQVDKLPGYNILRPAADVLDIDITLTPATIVSYLGNGSLLYKFNAPVYLDTSPGSSGKAYLFGPTVQMKRGATAYIKLTNNLTNPQTNSTKQFDIGITNFHTHGLHDSPGQLSQGPAVYTGGDNVLVHINPGSSLSMNNTIDYDHLPGLHWYHPHKHGSTSTQAFTSNGLIIVDDDDTWLPDDGGCAPMKKLLSSAPDYILHIELLTFGPPIASNVSDGNYQDLSHEGNSTLCCGNSTTNQLDGLGDDQDIAFINGG
jgi:Multicopper oxidase